MPNAGARCLMAAVRCSPRSWAFYSGRSKGGLEAFLPNSCQAGFKDRSTSRIFGVKRWECEVLSNDNVATFIKELVLKLPEGEEVDFRAGGYVQFEIPSYDIAYKDILVGEEYLGDWNKFGVFDHTSRVDEPTIRAYSMANYPEEKGIMKFNIRVASPPLARIFRRENVIVLVHTQARGQSNYFWSVRRIFCKRHRS